MAAKPQVAWEFYAKDLETENGQLKKLLREIKDDLSVKWDLPDIKGVIEKIKQALLWKLPE